VTDAPRRAETWPERSALEWLWRERFSSDGRHAACPACGGRRAFQLLLARDAYTCGACGHQIDPREGTVFHRSRTPLRTWFAVVDAIRREPELSPRWLQRELGLSYTNAWRMLSRLRALPADALELRAPAPAPTDRLGDPVPSRLRVGAGRVSGEPVVLGLDGREIVLDGRTLAILEAAQRAVVRDGFEGIRLSAIAEQAGTSSATVLHRFRSTEEVLLAAMRLAGQRLERSVVAALSEEADLPTSLRRFAELALPTHLDARDELLLEIELWVRALHVPALRQECESISGRWRTLLTQLFTRAAERGECSPRLAPEAVADVLLALVNGLGVKVLLQYPWTSSERVHALVADTGLRLLRPTGR